MTRIKLPPPSTRVNVSKLKVQFGRTPSKPGSRLIDKRRPKPTA